MTKRSSKIGVLITNIGTPDSTEVPAVRRYLREFLSDPYVVDINPIGRWLLLNCVVLPTRPKNSAEAYKAIWTPEGSPLLVHTQNFAKALQESLGDSFKVIPAMRYGTPSITSGMQTLKDEGIDRIVLFPLFPQYAASSSGTSIIATMKLASERWNVPSLSVVPAFYDNPGLLQSYAAVGQPVIDKLKPDHVLFSFHGLPERHVRKSDETGDHCLMSADCSAKITFANRNCYRAQCFATAAGIAEALKLEDDKWSIAFQSRLGRAKWIEPYTDIVLNEMPKCGIRRVAVFCPAFVADCLETLEEIGIRAQEDFIAHGGEALELVPSLNSHPVWVNTATSLVKDVANA